MVTVTALTGPPVLPDPPVLRDGDDLVLRAHRSEDADAVVEQCVDPLSIAMTTVPTPYVRADAESFIAAVAQDWAQSRTASFAVELDGRFAGTVDLRLREAGWAETGYGLHPAARGRGVMTRALRLVLGWGFTELGLAGVHWEAVAGNEASWRVAQACGFRREGEVRGFLVHRGERRDGWIGSLLADDPRG